MNKELDEGTRQAIALKRFSLLGPVLNGQIKVQRQYFEELSTQTHDMPFYGPRRYSAKTLQGWLEDYRRCGIDALKPGYRKDRGRHRKLDEHTMEAIRKKRLAEPRTRVTVLYENMIQHGELDPGKVSLQTFYRFLGRTTIAPETLKERESPEILRYAYEEVNRCWQVDTLYGPYIKDGRSKRQTYLIAFIDDASRFIPYSRFYWSQRYEDLRDAFKEAVLRRGIPTLVYADNGKIFRTQQFDYICASIGSTLIHAKPFTPNQRGKVERYFRTVRDRFLNTFDWNTLTSLDDLNERYGKWLENDYLYKEHSSIGMSPWDYFQLQLSKLKTVSDPQWLEEAFLLRTTRKVSHDATLQLGKVLYEADQRLAGQRVEVRFDPEWLLKNSQPLLLYMEGKRVGEARCVNFQDNAVVRRRGNNRPEPRGTPGPPQGMELPNHPEYEPAISFKDMMGGEGL